MDRTPHYRYFQATVETKQKFGVLTFYIAKHTSTCTGSLLGLNDAISLGLIHIVNTIQEETIGKDTELNTILKRYTPSVFNNKIGKMKDVIVKLSIDPGIDPVAMKHRRIPFHLREEKVEKEIQRLLEADVIERVDEPTGWVSPVVIGNKPNGDIRLCVDMTEPNKAIKLVHHVIPTIDDIKYKVNGAEFFSKIDLNKGYHQLELDVSSRNITTFSTHVGLARYKRLNFGCKSATEIFHENIRKKLIGIKGVLNIHDDILIYGRNREEHHNILSEVLEMLQSCGLTANDNKCEFYKRCIKFYGLIFSNEGVSPDPGKVEALKNATVPNTKRELKSFLGMTNFSSHFINNYSNITASLRKLTCDNEKWKWTPEINESFNTLKESLSESCLLHYFDPKLETEIICDASPIGLGAILVQNDNEVKKVIAYGSRALNKTEQKYGQIEREALSILFGCLKFQSYLLGAKFTILTDHLPLVPCFNKPKSQMPYRIERIRMKLQGFDYVVKHIPGKSNASDYISRHVVDTNIKATKEEKEVEEHVHAIIKTIPDSINLEDIRKEIGKDPLLSRLRNMLHDGKIIRKNDDSFCKFKKVYKELYIAENLIMRNDRIVIPEALQIENAVAKHQF